MAADEHLLPVDQYATSPSSSTDGSYPSSPNAARTRPRRGWSSCAGGKAGSDVGSVTGATVSRGGPGVCRVHAAPPGRADCARGSAPSTPIPSACTPATVAWTRRFSPRTPTRVELCLLEPDGRGGWLERRVTLPERAHGVWYGFVPASRSAAATGCACTAAGSRSAACGTTRPSCCWTPTPAPARATLRLRPELFGHRVDRSSSGDPATLDERDSAPYAPHGVVDRRCVRLG